MKILAGCGAVVGLLMFLSYAHFVRRSHYTNIQSIINIITQGFDVQMELEELVYRSRGKSNCDLCQDIVSFVYKCIRKRILFKDIKELVETQCEEMDELFKLNCSTTTEKYGPHVFKILRRRYARPRTICEEINECLEIRTVHPKVPAPSTTTDTNNANETLLQDNETTLVDRDNGSLPTDQPNLEEGNISFPANTNWFEESDSSLLTPVSPVESRDTLRIVHITDVHISDECGGGDGGEGASACGTWACCQQAGGGAGSGWHPTNCSVTPKTLDFLLRQVARLEPDLVMFTGDCSNRHTWEYGSAGHLRLSAAVAAQFTRHLGQTATPVLPVLGNHDMFPVNLYSLGRPVNKKYTLEFARNWENVTKLDPEEKARQEKYGYYSKLLVPGLRVVVYNSNYGSARNWYNVLPQNKYDYGRMQDWLQETLTAARRDGQKVILATHHPPGRRGMATHYGRYIKSLYIEFKDIVVLHIMGHTHSDEFHMVTDTPNSPVGVELTAPSVACFDGHNPSIRVLYLDAKSFQLLDYDQFYMDLQKTVSTGREHFVLGYRFTDEYGLPDASPASFRRLKDMIEHDNSTSEKFFKHLFSNSAVKQCDAQCRQLYICHLGYSSRNLQNCGDYKPLTP